MANTKNLIEIHIAVLLFGLAGLFGKWVTQSAIVIVFGRVFFAFISLAIIIPLFKQKFALKSRKDYWYLGLLGFILAIHWVTFFYSIQISTVAIGLLTFSTFPVFTVLLEPYFFPEKLQWKDILLALITFIGVALVIPDFELGNQSTQGALWGIVSGATFAILAILNRKFSNTYSSFVIAFYQDLSAAIVLLPLVLLEMPSIPLKDLLLLILLGVVFTGLSHSLFINGLKTVKAKTASIIGSLEPVYGILAAAILLQEFPNLREITGGVIILGAVTFATLKPKSMDTGS